MGLKQRAYLLGWVLYSLFKTYLVLNIYIFSPQYYLLHFGHCLYNSQSMMKL